MNKEKVLVVIWKIGIYHDLSLFYLCYHLNSVQMGEGMKVSSLLESIEKEAKRRSYAAMIRCLPSYQGQVEETLDEFHHGSHSFYRANDEYAPHWQGESRGAYELVYWDLRQIEAQIYATADDLLHEISREIAPIRRKIEELQ
jgi:hypothetical protein